jgi:hypothetical protein
LAGEPITTPWLAAETLDVSYEMRWYLSTEDVPYEMVISGQTHTGIVRASNITYSAGIYQNFVNAFSTTPGGQGGNSGEIGLYTGTIGAVTGTPSGASGWARGITEHPYVANSRKRTGSHVVGPTTANMGAVTAIFKGNIVQSYQMSVSPALQKNADWTFTFNCETPTWGRYTPP